MPVYSKRLCKLTDTTLIENYHKMRAIKLLLLIQILLTNIHVFGQNQNLIITPQIKLPNDSLVKQKLLNSLQQFLVDKNNDLSKSKVIETTHFKKYIDFFDAMKDIEISKKYNDTSFFKCYLKNVILQPNKNFKIELSYYGITKDNEVINRLNISLIAKLNNEIFQFYCPFEENVKSWKSQKVGNIEFFYKDSFNKSIATNFDNYNTILSKKLKVNTLQFKYYKCQDIQEVYSLMGIDYDLSRNGEVRSGLFDLTNKIFLAGTNSDQYKHDLTHTYFGLKFTDSLRNWTAEEGYNVYSTDFWGETTAQNFQYLKEYISSNPNITLISAFEQNLYLKYPIPIKYPLSALLMRKVEKEYGFDKVLELISCGESDENYFKKLKEITGITKEMFDNIIKEELYK